MSVAVEKEIEELQKQVKEMEPGQSNKVSIVVFSGDLDRILAALIIATGAVAMGMKAVLFFTFWGTPVLRASGKKAKGKDNPFHISPSST